MDEVGTEQSSDADSDLFRLDWSDELRAITYSGASQTDHAQRSRELLAFVDTGACDKVLPKTQCIEYPLEKTARSRSGIGFLKARTDPISNITGSGVFVSRRVRAAT